MKSKAVNLIRSQALTATIGKIQRSVAILAMGALLMTTVIPDTDHHFNFSTAPQTVAFACDAHGSGAQDHAGESKHHCLACPSSSQRIASPTAYVFVSTLLLFSFVSSPATDYHPQVVDLHYSGKRSPPRA